MTYGFPLPDDFFEHGQNLYGPSGLVAILNRLAGSSPLATQRETHVYLDFEAGSDEADGTSWSRAIATFDRVNEVLPKFLNHNTTLHCRGTYTGGNFVLSPHVSQGVLFLIDGGMANKTVLDGPHVADSASTAAIGLSSLSMTTDEFAGYMVEIVDGPGAGNVRMIQGNDATTITPTRKFSTTPTGATFRIVKPSTMLKARVTFGGTGEGNAVFQNLTTDSRVFLFRASCGVILTSFVTETTDSFSAIQAYSARAVSISGTQYDPFSFSTVGSSSQTGGVGVINKKRTLFRGGSGCLGMFESTLGDVDLYESMALNLLLGFGTRVRGHLEISNMGLPFGGGTTISNSGSYAPVRIDGSSGSGIKMIDSYLALAADIVVENHASHGIECINSTLDLTSAISGAGNGGAGLRAHLNAAVLVNPSAVPTLTGNIPAEVSIDGTTEASTWAAIAGGTPVIDSTEFTIVKANT